MRVAILTVDAVTNARNARAGSAFVVGSWQAAIFAIAMVAAGCTTGTTDADADRADRGSGPCSVDADCDDGSFCNGVERCMAGTGADARGCRHTGAPCAANESCDENGDACVTGCVGVRDADGDGHDRVACGGDDCDDADANRAPGRTEVCDLLAHDEDCDPVTYGFRDADADAHGDGRCCNLSASGEPQCGDDCDDMRPDQHPGLAEACDLVDNDCDDAIDETLTTGTYYADCDGDLFGAGQGTPTASCSPPSGSPSGCARSGGGWSAQATDCDDDDPGLHPGAAELCTTIDENCVGGGYDTLTCMPGATETCMVCDAVGQHACTDGCDWAACDLAAFQVTWQAADLERGCAISLDPPGGPVTSLCSAWFQDAGYGNPQPDSGTWACDPFGAVWPRTPVFALPRGGYQVTLDGDSAAWSQIDFVDETTGATTHTAGGSFRVIADANSCHAIRIAFRGECVRAVTIRYVSP